MTIILDGKGTSVKVCEEVRNRVESLSARGIQPGLAVVQVGEDPASSVYVRNKRRICESLGIASVAHDLPEDTSEFKLLSLIDELNNDPSVHGILVQLPLPAQIEPETVVKHISSTKDVDGFHPTNAGQLFLGRNKGYVPCTPLGVMRLFDEFGVSVEGKRAVVIGRSNIVGKPMAQLLLKANATVTMAHSRTADLPGLCREADILVVAIGRAEIVKKDWIKPGAAVVDVGIQRNADGKLVGDVAFAEVKDIAGHITPVPGGVGPMTIAMLLQNTFEAYAN